MFPFPHFFIPEVFPGDFYRELQHNMPDPEAMVPIEQARPVKGYKERFVLGFEDKHLETLPESKRRFWSDFRDWMTAGRFSSLVLHKFQPFIQERFNGQSVQFNDELLLVQDVTNYKLGPHTDAPRKVVTMLFYLPPDESQKHLGTSIYVPNDLDFRCPGGPHHQRDQFSRLRTMPFMPNSLFAFFKTDNSFHGVEPVADPDTRRWLLLYDIYVRQVEQPKPQPQVNMGPKLKFSF
ncbi:MAG: hypothetical protein KF804_08955 [Burkholderiales bacterium]|nr:hypothetical protein [Burkholderiales bacterium]